MHKTALALGLAAGAAGLALTPGPTAQSLHARQERAGIYYVRDANGTMGGGDVGAVEGPEPIRPFNLVSADRSTTLALDRPPYTFFPQAGTLGADLFTTNYVDMNAAPPGDPTQSGMDFECTNYSYQGHTGHDSVIDGFREQEIGVPIFAVLDGTVFAAHDGEPDDQTTFVVGRTANYVAIRHQDGYETLYYHLKRSSVRVALNQRVLAGTEIGLTGSSGASTWPHLHFTSFQNGRAFEPSAGPCRPGSSGWTNQPAIQRDTYISSFTYGTAEFTGRAGYPFDEVTRRGSYARGTSTIYFRFSLKNRPANSSYRFMLTRPDGSTAMDNSGAFSATAAGRQSWWWFLRNVTLNANGTWSLAVWINNTLEATAPFVVSDGTVANRAPFAVQSVALEPESAAGDVTICRVTPETLYYRDPDYDIVRYRYRWLLRGTVVRDVTSAALSDMLPANLNSPRSELRCEVTPSDGALTAATVVAQP